MITSIRKPLKYIFPLLVLIMIGGLLLSRTYRPDSTVREPEVRIEASEASGYIGTVAKVCGEVSTAEYLPEIGGRPTFINLGPSYPNQHFTAVIWEKNRSRWSPIPEKQYTNRHICVTGLINRHENTPQIEVRHPDQISIQ